MDTKEFLNETLNDTSDIYVIALKAAEVEDSPYLKIAAEQFLRQHTDFLHHLKNVILCANISQQN